MFSDIFNSMARDLLCHQVYLYQYELVSFNDWHPNSTLLKSTPALYCCFYLSLSPNPYCEPLRIIWFWSVFSTQHRDGFCSVNCDQNLIHETAELNPLTFVGMINMFVLSSILLLSSNINFRYCVSFPT